MGFDDKRLVADAEIVLPSTLAAWLGIEALVDETVDLGAWPGGGKRGAKVITLIAAMGLGADSIDDCDILRRGHSRRVELVLLGPTRRADA